MASTWSELERSIDVLADNFNQFAGTTRTIKRKKFGKMLDKELSHFLTNTQCKEAVDELMKSLDANKDGKINFKEYCTLIGRIAKMQTQDSSEDMAPTLSELERSIDVLAKNFNQYAGKKRNINRTEFGAMLETELCHFLTNTQCKEAVDERMKSLDSNDDGKINFEEYWTLIGRIAKMRSKLMALQNQESA